MKSKITFYIGISIVCLLVLAGGYVFTNSTSKQLKNKEDEKQITCPVLSFSSMNLSSENQKITEICNLARANKEHFFNSKISENDQYYSMLIIVGYYEADAIRMTYQIETFVIDKQAKKVLTNEEIAHRFQIENSDIKNRIEEVLHYYYQEEINEGYFTKEMCDYNCFLDLRGLYQNDLTKGKYYIEEGKFVVYFPFSLDSRMQDETFYADPMKAFRILISY